MADDLGKQVELQNELNKALKASIGLLKQQGRLMSQQAGYAKDMCDSLKCANLDGLQGQTEELNQGLDQAADSAQNAGSKMSQAADQAGGAFQKVLDKAPMIGLMAGAFRGVVGAVKGTFETFKNLGVIVGGVISTFGKLAQTILMAPWKTMTALIKMSQHGGVDPLRQALEDVREEMGNLATNEGKMLADSVSDLRGQMGDMAGTGIAMGRVFGYGREGLANFLKENLELSKAVGIGFGTLRGEFKKNAVALAMYRKGLGITTEQQAIQIKVAAARGVSLKEESRAFASMAINMGKTYGVNAKVVGKAMAEMQSDVSNFGHMSKKQLGASATYAAKLGIEVKDLMNVFNKFDNFENAAKGAAQLAQTFGMNVDAMALLSAESPAEQVDMLRKSFFDTGKTLKDLNRHERKLLETQTGLTGAALESAFANENMGMSYADIEAGAEDAEKKQMTQAEAMLDLSKSIKKMVKDSSHDFDSFFGAFAKGFTKGIERSKPFRKIMRNLQRSLRIIYRAGLKVGKMFVKMFPGVKDVLKGLGKMFDPKRFKRLARGLTRTFKTFFKDLQTDPEKAVKKFVKSFQGVIKKHLGGSGAVLNQVKEGFKKFFKAVGGIVAGMIPILKKKLVEALEGLVNLLANPDAFKSGAKEMGKGAGGFIMEVFGPIIESIRGNKELNDRLTKALGTLWDMFMKSVAPVLQKALAGLFLLVFSKAVIFGAISTVGGWLGGELTKWVGGLFKNHIGPAAKNGMKSAGKGIAKGAKGFFKTFIKGVGRAFKGIGKLLAKIVGGGLATAAAVVVSIFLAAFSADKLSEGIGDKMEASFGTLGGKAAMWATVIVDFFTLGLLSSDTLEKVANFFGNIQKTIGDFMEKMGFGTMFRGIIQNMAGAFDMFSGLWKLVKGIFTGDGAAVFDGLKKMWSGLVDTVLGGWKTVLGLIKGAGGAIGKAFLWVVEQAVKLVLVGIPKAFIAIGGAIGDAFYWVVNEGIPKAILWLEGAAETLADAVVSLFEGMQDVLGGAFAFLFDAVTSPSYWLDKITKFGGDLLDGLWAGLKGAWVYVRDWFTGLIDDVAKEWGIMSPSTKMEVLGQSLMDGLLAALMYLPNKVKEVAGKAMDFVKENLNPKKALKVGTEMVAGVASGLGGMKDAVAKEAKEAWDGFKGFFKIGSPSKLAAEGGKSIGEGVKGGMQKELKKGGGLGATVEESLDVKLKGLEDQQALVDRIQELSSIPKQLKKASKKLSKISKKKMKAHIDKAMGVIEMVNNALVDGANKMDLKVLTPKKIKTLATVGDVIGEVADIASNTRKLTKKAAKIPKVETVKADLARMEKVLAEVGTFAANMTKSSVSKRTMKPLKKVLELVEIVNDIAGMPNLASKKKAANIVKSVNKLKGIAKPLNEFGDVTAALKPLDSIGKAMNYVSDFMSLGISPKKAKSIVGGVKKMKGVVKPLGEFNSKAVTESLVSLNRLQYGLVQLDKIMASPLLSDSDKAAEVVKSVQTMKGLLTPVADTVAEVQAFSGGNLNVTHNLPNTQIQLQVNIDSKELGKAIAVTNIGKDTANGKAFMATQPTPASVEG